MEEVAFGSKGTESLAALRLLKVAAMAPIQIALFIGRVFVLTHIAQDLHKTPHVDDKKCLVDGLELDPEVINAPIAGRRE